MSKKRKKALHQAQLFAQTRFTKSCINEH